MEEPSHQNEIELQLEGISDELKPFFKKNLEDIASVKLDRAKKIKELVGESTDPQDFKTAEAELDLDDHNDKKSWEQKRLKGVVTAIPDKGFGDKNIMIALLTDDETVSKLFNDAAQEVTTPYNGFHQIGSNSKAGFSAWELWADPDQPKPSLRKLEEQTVKTMLNLAKK